VEWTAEVLILPGQVQHAHPHPAFLLSFRHPLQHLHWHHLHCLFALQLAHTGTKFQDLFVISEYLFSLINGDNMFTTYKGMFVASAPAYIFSKIYLYIFICLFIYVVLSVFISLITDTYETLHEH